MNEILEEIIKGLETSKVVVINPRRPWKRLVILDGGDTYEFSLLAQNIDGIEEKECYHATINKCRKDLTSQILKELEWFETNKLRVITL